MLHFHKYKDRNLTRDRNAKVLIGDVNLDTHPMKLQEIYLFSYIGYKKRFNILYISYHLFVCNKCQFQKY